MCVKVAYVNFNNKRRRYDDDDYDISRSIDVELYRFGSHGGKSCMIINNCLYFTLREQNLFTDSLNVS